MISAADTWKMLEMAEMPEMTVITIAGQVGRSGMVVQMKAPAAKIMAVTSPTVSMRYSPVRPA